MESCNEKKNENVEGYLGLIQEPISRMSMISSVLKGFAATAVVGLILKDNASVANAIQIACLLSAFLFVEVYYLCLEKRFRYLFNLVAEGKHPVDFSMKIPKSREANVSIWTCLKSPSIWLFYGPLYACIVWCFIGCK